MGIANLTLEAVEEAIAQARSVGREVFRAEHGFGASTTYDLVVDGEHFDPKAIAGVAHGLVRPDLGPLGPGDFRGDERLMEKFRELGFEVARRDGAEAAEGWDRLLALAREARADPAFDKYERNYKEEIAEALARVLHEDDSDLLTELPRLWRSKYDNGRYRYNLTNFRQHDWFLAWMRADPDAPGAVRGFADTSIDVVERFRRFAEAAEAATGAGRAERQPAAILALGSLFAFAIEPTEVPLIRARVFADCERAVGYEPPPTDPAVERFAGHLDFAREVRERMQSAQIPVRDMLDVQGALFVAAGKLNPSPDPKPDPIDPIPASRMDVWWVCQGDSYAASREAGLLWAPKVDRAGRTKGHWERLAEAKPGDRVLHYAGGQIKAVSEVVAPAEDAPRPDELASESWSDEGVRVRTRYRELTSPISLTDLPAEWRTPEAGPFTSVGSVQQGYFFEVRPTLVARLAERFPDLGLQDIATGIVESDRPGDLAAKLYVSTDFIESVLELLEEKRQLIFYGPPGTGKTYIARALARFVSGDDPERVEVVQFHPSYSYEDFVQGYRPRPSAGGGLTYELVDGPLLRLARRAQAAPQRIHVLLVDEINRGNLPRIFGELLYLLEYRDDRISLMYGDERFALPGNLWMIGTMNTADRSIGLIDAALRRRFHFKALFPGRAPLERLLDDWLSDHSPAMRPVARYVDELNRLLRERFGEHLQVGHSYFMRSELDEQRLERIWEVDILPFLEDQLFGQEGELKRFTLASIRDQLETSPQPNDIEVLDADDLPDGVPAEDRDT